QILRSSNPQILKSLHSQMSVLSDRHQSESLLPAREQLGERRWRGRRIVDPGARLVARYFEKLAVAREIDQAEGGQAGLPCSEEVSGTAQAQITLGDFEPVGRFRHR